MRGDALASGSRSATFGPAKVSQEQWDRAFGKDEPVSDVEVRNGRLRCKAHPAYTGVYALGKGNRVKCDGCRKVRDEFIKANS